MNTKEMLDLRLQGMTYAQIGERAGVSRQYIQHLLSPPSSIRKFVIEKYEGKCNDCGLIVGISGHVHHAGDEVDTYNDIPNLQLLCVACHRAVHNIERKPTVEEIQRNDTIRSLHERGYSSRRIAALVDLSHVQVCNIINVIEGKATNTH